MFVFVSLVVLKEALLTLPTHPEVGVLPTSIQLA